MRNCACHRIGCDNESIVGINIGDGLITPICVSCYEEVIGPFSFGYLRLKEENSEAEDDCPSQ